MPEVSDGGASRWFVFASDTEARYRSREPGRGTPNGTCQPTTRGLSGFGRQMSGVKWRDTLDRRASRLTCCVSWPGAPPPSPGCCTPPCCTTGGRGPSSGPETAASRQTRRMRGSAGSPRSRPGRPLPSRRGARVRRGSPGAGPAAAEAPGGGPDGGRLSITAGLPEPAERCRVFSSGFGACWGGGPEFSPHRVVRR